MLKNFLLLAWRNLSGNKLFTAINVVGLAIGLTCVILIMLFVRHETSFDRHWEHANRIYKVMRTFTPPGQANLELAANAPQVGPLLAADYPEFDRVIRINQTGQLIFTHPETNQSFFESGMMFADPDIYEVFNIPLLAGQWEGALEAPFQMVINESLAEKYFPGGNAVGESLVVANQVPVQIMAVMGDFGGKSHIEANAFISIATPEAMFGENYLLNWGSNNFHTYVIAPDNFDVENFRSQMPEFLDRHSGPGTSQFSFFEVIPLTDIHLHSQREFELGTNGSMVTVITFTAIAVVILLIACFNFMNLSTARSVSRAREVGLRKTLGADQGELIGQFMAESILLSLVAVVLASIAASLLLPAFNNLLELELNFDLTDPLLAGMLMALVLVVGVAAGSYPAFFLSSFSASKILKGELTRGSGGARLRKILVVVQFAISIALVVASTIALSQLRYALALDPGFVKEQVLTYQGGGLEGLGDYYTMKQELLRHPEIISVTAANLMPGDQNTNAEGVRYEGDPETIFGLPYLNVDYDFFETFEIEFLTGRSFSRERGTDIFVNPTEENPRTVASFILNEAAATQLGYAPDEALGKWVDALRNNGERSVRGTVIGVIDNIYFSSIRESVKPVFYRVMPPRFEGANFANLNQMAVRISGNNLDETLAYIEDTWDTFLPGVPIRQQIMDAKFEALYRNEQRQGDLFTIFSAMAIFIAALGLFGLASFLTEQRTREIGIRKVLGSTVMGIVALLTRDFSRLVLIANLIAWPLAWYFMNGWLQNFAYRIDMNIGVFIFAGVLAWVIAAATVGSLAAFTANINPTQSLRHE